MLSPGISPLHPIVLEAKKRGIEVIGEIELGLRGIDSPILAITGTNGKTTTTLLTAHLLQQAGMQAKPLGNIGVPLASEARSLKKGIYGVLELSSFQIETISTPHIKHGVLLNITPDHLDRYPSMQEYAKAKIGLKDSIASGGVLIVHGPTYKQFLPLFEGHSCLLYGDDPSFDLYTDRFHLYYQGKIAAPVPDSLLGKRSHDLENFMAASALSYLEGVAWEKSSFAYGSFQKPKHRLQYCMTVQGVLFYDDSKGTNVDAVVRAVESFDVPIHLVAGGVHKGASYDIWKEPFLGKVKSLALIGQAAGMIQKEIGFPESQLCNSLEEAVRCCFNKAKKGEIILLSPGCSSFDMFKDYADRGRQFCEIVSKIRRECEE